MEDCAFLLRLAQRRSSSRAAVPEPGSVWLVGAGPGDPDLLTLGAARALGAADLILHDHGCSGALGFVRPGAVRVAVGKRKAAAPVPQARIIARMLAGARAGQRVVRLKAGDPLVFGRAAEELAALSAAGIPWRIVPGVSAGTAAPAAAGIPVTMRGQSGSVTWITAHDAGGDLPDAAAWQALARLNGTIVVFMGLSRLPAIAGQLLAAGLAPPTPVAIIGQASQPGEVVLRATLRESLRPGLAAGVPSPGLIVIGAVAGFGATAAAALADAA